jgi:Domain of unknown function (DUF4440)
MMRVALIRPSYCILILITGCYMRALAQQRTVESDREALIALENKWLRSEHSATELDSILASDFVHPVVTGDLLNKAQHIHFSSAHLPPANLQNHFDGLKVRLYGDVGIVNGLVVTTNDKGEEVRRTVFTDVFVYRDQRWQAINSQENEVRKLETPP